jgi:hypothetical protein
MNAYFVTVPISLTEEQREAAEAHGWRISAELNSDVMAAAVPTTTIEVSHSSPEQAVDDVAQAFGLDPEALRVEER